MSRGRVQRLANLRIEPQIGGGNELAPQLAREDTIQPAQHFWRVMRAGHDRLHRHLDHRGDERSGDTVSGDVSHKEANPVLIDGNELVEIAGDGSHRMISGV